VLAIPYNSGLHSVELLLHVWRRKADHDPKPFLEQSNFADAASVLLAGGWNTLTTGPAKDPNHSIDRHSCFDRGRYVLCLASDVR
jgi:hypothetical protein